MHLPPTDGTSGTKKMPSYLNIYLSLFITFCALLVALDQLITFRFKYRADGKERNQPQRTISTGEKSNTSSCEFPIVYNKPPKTGSTFIQSTISKWSESNGRGSYKCSSWPHLTAVSLQECLPSIPSTCHVLNCHVRLDKNIESILNKRLPNYRIITSTRYAPHRIISYFMQMKKISSPTDQGLEEKLRNFLREEYNPYEILSWYKSGPLEYKQCPLTKEEELNIFNVVSKYHIVIDVNLPKESNKILNNAGLFELPLDSERVNERGSSNMKLGDETIALLKNVSCFEQAVHRALQYRMSSLYQKATGQECISHNRLGSMTTCLAEIERENLKDTWIF